jgi:hypothetical protein
MFKKGVTVHYLYEEEGSGAQKHVSLPYDLISSVPESLFAKLVQHEKDMKVLKNEVEVDGKVCSAYVIDKRFLLMDKIIQFVKEPSTATLTETQFWTQKLLEEAGLGEAIRSKV